MNLTNVDNLSWSTYARSEGSGPVKYITLSQVASQWNENESHYYIRVMMLEVTFGGCFISEPKEVTFERFTEVVAKIAKYTEEVFGTKINEEIPLDELSV